MGVDAAAMGWAIDVVSVTGLVVRRYERDSDDLVVSDVSVGVSAVGYATERGV